MVVWRQHVIDCSDRLEADVLVGSQVKDASRQIRQVFKVNDMLLLRLPAIKSCHDCNALQTFRPDKQVLLPPLRHCMYNPSVICNIN